MPNVPWSTRRWCAARAVAVAGAMIDTLVVVALSGGGERLIAAAQTAREARIAVDLDDLIQWKTAHHAVHSVRFCPTHEAHVVVQLIAHTRLACDLLARLALDHGCIVELGFFGQRTQRRVHVVTSSSSSARHSLNNAFDFCIKVGKDINATFK